MSVSEKYRIVIGYWIRGIEHLIVNAINQPLSLIGYMHAQRSESIVLSTRLYFEYIRLNTYIRRKLAKV